MVAGFHKYEGLGNDFVVLDWLDAVDMLSDGEVTPARAVAICDRHRGVGADGVLLVLPPADPASALARMRVLNSDGSRSEMCGNGVRCVALHLVRTRGAGKGGAGTVTLETDAGPRACAIDSVGADAASANVTVDMGTVRVVGKRRLAELGESALDVECTLADAGNPHAILFGTFARSDVDRLGPRLSTNAAFPNGTNVEFAHAGPAGIDLVVWERGAGLTLACGTGACATAAVACAQGLAAYGKPVTVRLPGGPLEITVDAGGRATMRGPARHVFSGTL
ncbi:MAG: diaminopimelate epimerase [Polyangiaceae bacterium]